MSGKPVENGDGDPLDICVLTERLITSGVIILEAIPIGGFRMIDKGEADDKIIAVLKQDEVYGSLKDVSDCPETLINRLKHYFLTYKNMPGQELKTVEITHTYGREEAQEVIRRSIRDYDRQYRSHLDVGV
jgi:inorganic pyrophosphatase